jgi:hypothetical protein
MFSVLLLLLVSLRVAGAVAVYAAYVHRGQDVPHAPWLGEAMKRGVAALPTLDNQPRRPLELDRITAPAVATARVRARSLRERRLAHR